MSLFQFPESLLRRIALLALSLFFVVAGVNHFLMPELYVSIMPPYLPAHLELVYLSGLFEILGGLGVLFHRTRRLAGWGLVLLLVAVFPANLHMALHPDPFVEAGIPVWALYARLPLQLVLIAWVLWVTRPDETP